MSAVEKGKYPGHGIRGFVFEMHQGNSHFTLTIKRNLEVTGSRKLHVFIVKGHWQQKILFLISIILTYGILNYAFS